MNALQDISDFLGRKRIAVIGVSRNPKDFTRTLYREFKQRGYDVVPVNPLAEEIEGQPCYAHVQDVSPAVDSALLLTKSTVTQSAVNDCVQAGIRSVWMYRAVGAGAVSEPALRACAENGVRVVAGECPFMFLPGSGFPHNIHAACKKLIGRYPR